MKENFVRMWRSGIALLLALCMVAGFVPTSAFAAENNKLTDKDVINYVSFGASNANGYGLTGYLPDDITVENKATANVYGYQRLPVGSYPYLIAEALNEAAGGYVSLKYYNGDLKEKQPFSNVHVDQLAMSSMRVEELRFLLDETYAGDSYTDWRFYELGYDNRQSQNWFGNAEKDLDTLRAVYENAIINADVITLDMGINNFGVYISHQVGNPDYNETLANLDPAMAEAFEQAKAYVMQIASQSATEVGAMLEGMEPMIDALAYALVGFCMNFDIVVEKIRELNPNATIVVVSIQNLLTGLDIELPGIDQALPLDEIFGAVINSANIYTASISEHKDSYLYADVRQNGRVEFFVDELLAYNGDPSTLSQNMKDAVDILDNDLFVSYRVTALVQGYLMNVVSQMLQPYATRLYPVYLANNFQDLVAKFIEDGENNFPVLRSAGVIADIADALRQIYGVYHQGMTETLPVALDIAYDVVMELFRDGVEDHTITFAALSHPQQRQIEKALLNEILGTAQRYIEQLPTNPEVTFDADEAFPGGFYEYIAEKYGFDVETVKSVACMGIRTGIGNSFFGHPTPNGHRQIADAVLNALDNEITGEQIVAAELKMALEALCKLVETYGPEVAAEIWEQWETYGYIDAIKDTAAQLEAVLNARYDYYTTEALPALEQAIRELIAQKDVLCDELAGLEAALAAKKAELEEVIGRQEIGCIHNPDLGIDVDLGNNEHTQAPCHECTVENESIRAELEAAIADIECAIAAIKDLIADVEADIADMMDLIQQIRNVVAELELTVRSIVAAVNDLRNAIDEVSAVLKDTDAIVEKLQAIGAIVAEAAQVVDMTIGVAVSMTNDIDMLLNMVDESANALYEKFMTGLDACYEQIPEAYRPVIGAALLLVKQGLQMVEAEIMELAMLKALAIEAELKAVAALGDAAMQAELQKLMLELSANEEVINQKLAALNAQIMAEIQAKKAEMDADIQAQIAALQAAADAELIALQAELDALKAQLIALGEDAAEDVKAVILAQIARVEADMKAVEEHLACALEHLDNAALMAYNQIVAEVTKAYEEAVAALNQELAQLYAQFEAALREMSKEVAGGLIQSSYEALTKAIEAIVTPVEDLLKNATTGNLVVDDDFKFVAIGDASSAAVSYADKLAAMLNAEAAANGVDAIDFVNAGKLGNTVAAAREDLSEIVDADLVTIGFSNVAFLDRAVAGAMNNVQVDWAALVGSDNVPYVEELLAAMAQELAESGIEGEYAQLLHAIIEIYAYATMEYILELPQLVAEINALNPEALVVIVGMYNPLENVTIALDETTTFDISKYVAYMVQGAAVHGIATAVLTGNTIYVHAPAAQTQNTDSVLTVMELISMAYNHFAALNASEEGHNYIAAQIRNALNVTYVASNVLGLLGDVNMDGVVNSADVNVLFRYASQDATLEALTAEQLLLADVNQDGVVNSADVNVLFRYVSKDATLVWEPKEITI